jgi:hypothetical protein
LNATLAVSERKVDTLEKLTFVRMDASPPRLTTHREATLRELDGIQVQADVLRADRERFKETLEAAGPAVFAAFQRDLPAKCHKLALVYVHEYMKTILPARNRCKDKVHSRHTHF